MTTDKRKERMAKTKTGLEPPTSVLTVDAPAICASHLLLYVMHLYCYIINRLGWALLLIGSPCMHAYIYRYILLLLLTPVNASSSPTKLL